MAYSPYYPPFNPYQQPIVQPQMPQQGRGVTKVRGPESAMQYYVAPNSQSEPLFDYNGYQFYIVSADGAGTKTLETFDFFPHVEKQPEPFIVNGVTFDSQEEYDKIMAVVTAAMEASDGIHGPVPAADEPAEPAVRTAARHSASARA